MRGANTEEPDVQEDNSIPALDSAVLDCDFDVGRAVGV